MRRTAALKRVQANLKRYRASVLKAAREGRLVPTEAELARKEGRDYEPADKLLQRILRERRARWEADTLAKMQASGKSPKDNNWKQKYKEPPAPTHPTSQHSRKAGAGLRSSRLRNVSTVAACPLTRMKGLSVAAIFPTTAQMGRLAGLMSVYLMSR
jgi:hypothetical protein